MGKTILSPKVVSSGVSYLDLILAGGVKYFAERALTPVVGNGTIKSGAVKLGAGLAAKKFLGAGMFGDAIGLGLSIDGVEDLLVSVLGSTGSGAEAQGDNW